jgi:hypothetical protein
LHFFRAGIRVPRVWGTGSPVRKEIPWNASSQTKKSQ